MKRMKIQTSNTVTHHSFGNEDTWSLKRVLVLE